MTDTPAGSGALHPYTVSIEIPRRRHHDRATYVLLGHNQPCARRRALLLHITDEAQPDAAIALGPWASFAGAPSWPERAEGWAYQDIRPDTRLLADHACAGGDPEFVLPRYIAAAAAFRTSPQDELEYLIVVALHHDSAAHTVAQDAYEKRLCASRSALFAEAGEAAATSILTGPADAPAISPATVHETVHHELCRAVGYEFGPYSGTVLA